MNGTVRSRIDDLLAACDDLLTHVKDGSWGQDEALSAKTPIDLAADDVARALPAKALTAYRKVYDVAVPAPDGPPDAKWRQVRRGSLVHSVEGCATALRRARDAL